MPQGTSDPQGATIAKRIDELDWLKSVCILLMIAFHLEHFEHLYPEAKHVVYTFHMPVFLIISGYLIKTNRGLRSFLSTLTPILIPYIIMEAAYTFAASLLPINEHIDHLTPSIMVKNLLLHPIGPYWFLHTLTLCYILTYATRNIPRLSEISRTIILFLMAWIANKLRIMPFSLSIYYIIGTILSTSNIKFTSFFAPSIVALPFIIAMLCFSASIDKSTCVGALFIFLAISFLTWVFQYVRGTLRKAFLFIGRNTLPILLFSPLFTLLAKFYQPFICSIDHTGIIFMLISVFLGAYGSIGIKYVLDRLGIWKLMTAPQKLFS